MTAMATTTVRDGVQSLNGGAMLTRKWDQY